MVCKRMALIKSPLKRENRVIPVADNRSLGYCDI